MICDRSPWWIWIAFLLILPLWNVLGRILCLLQQVVLIKIVLLMSFIVIKLACTAQIRKKQRIKLSMIAVFATCLARLLCHVMYFILSLFQNFSVLLRGIKRGITWDQTFYTNAFLFEEAMIALKMATKILPHFNNSTKLLLQFSKSSKNTS